MVGLGYATHAGSCAFADVAEEAGSTGLFRTRVSRLCAAAHRECFEHLVDGLADRPHLGVWAEVAGASDLPIAGDEHPGHVITKCDREVWVGLVITKLDVEWWIELFDPGVFELERFEFSSYDGPLDGCGAQHHPPGALVQCS